MTSPHEQLRASHGLVKAARPTNKSLGRVRPKETPLSCVSVVTLQMDWLTTLGPKLNDAQMPQSGAHRSII